MRLKTKVLSLAVSAALVSSSVAALAAPSWRFMGYDLKNTAPGSAYAKLEYEVDEKGLPTGNTRVNGYASKVEWKHAFFEAAYPHQGYNQLFLDGNAQELYTPSKLADSVQEYRRIYWEAKSPYGEYAMMYSMIPGVMPFTAQPAYVQFNNTNAKVNKTWVGYGFSGWKNGYNGDIIDAMDFINANAGKVDNTNTLNDIRYSYTALKSADVAVSGVLPKGFDLAAFAKRVPIMSQEHLSGPTYDNGNIANPTGMQVEAISKIEAAQSTASWYNDTLLTNIVRDAEIEWIYGGYELEEPYKMYEVAVVNGVVMDGSACSKLVFDGVDSWKVVKNGAVKPNIRRYTGGTANPQVGWELVWPEAEYPFNIYERKWVVDNAGKKVWTTSYRPSGKYAHALPSFVATNTGNLNTSSRAVTLTLVSGDLQDFALSALNGYDYEIDDVTKTLVIKDASKLPQFENSKVTFTPVMR